MELGDSGCHQAAFGNLDLDLDEGFIWKRGECGQGSFEVEAEGNHLSFDDSNMIVDDFDWTNRE